MILERESDAEYKDKNQGTSEDIIYSLKLTGRSCIKYTLYRELKED